MERGKKIEFETHLPKDMIQHIQSFLSRKEAARTTILSKSWRSAWLTRPSLVFDQRDFKNLDPRPSTVEFSKFVWKTMQRYGDSNLKIESFALQTQSLKIENLAQKWIVDAIKMGATDLNLEFEGCTFVLPPKVLESEALLRLSVSGCEIDGNVINCSLLKSLSLDSARLKRDDEMIKDIFSCCKSIEELSLSNCSDYKCRKLALSGMNLSELHKLRRVCLEKVEVDDSFFDDFEFRFPCLKDLSLVRCHGCSRIRIGSTSLQRISIVQVEVLSADFNVPNLANFSYSGAVIPSSLSILAREWESHISIKCYHSPTTSWYLSLKKLLTELSPSRISLSLDILVFCMRRSINIDHEGGIQALYELVPVAVEDLTIEAKYKSSCALLVGLFLICRPKILAHYWLPSKSCKYWNWMANNCSLKRVWEKLMKEMMSPNCGVPDQNMFGRFGLKEVNVEVYEEINLTEWRQLLLKEPFDALKAPSDKRKVCFRLKWW